MEKNNDQESIKASCDKMDELIAEQRHTMKKLLDQEQKRRQQSRQQLTPAYIEQDQEQKKQKALHDLVNDLFPPTY